VEVGKKGAKEGQGRAERKENSHPAVDILVQFLFRSRLGVIRSLPLLPRLPRLPCFSIGDPKGAVAGDHVFQEDFGPFG